MTESSKNFATILLLLVIALFLLFLPKPAEARANIRVCNTGALDFRVAKVEAIESFFAESAFITSSGWYEFPAGECENLGFDNYVWLGITATNEMGQTGVVMHQNVDIAAPAIQNIENFDVLSEFGGDAFCVHPTEEFTIRTERGVFQSECPQGYFLMPFIEELYYKGPCCYVVVREVNINVPPDSPVYPYTPAQVQAFIESEQ